MVKDGDDWTFTFSSWTNLHQCRFNVNEIRLQTLKSYDISICSVHQSCINFQMESDINIYIITPGDTVCLLGIQSSSSLAFVRDH